MNIKRGETPFNLYFILYYSPICYLSSLLQIITFEIEATNTFFFCQCSKISVININYYPQLPFSPITTLKNLASYLLSYIYLRYEHYLYLLSFSKSSYTMSELAPQQQTCQVSGCNEQRALGYTACEERKSSNSSHNLNLFNQFNFLDLCWHIDGDNGCPSNVAHLSTHYCIRRK